jgi:sugar-specific transcriptional regulator TrmB
MDVAMIVANAKLFFYNEVWKKLQNRPEVKRLGVRDNEMLRRHLREVIAMMKDELFFFPPDEAGSKEEFQRRIKYKLEAGLTAEILKELQRQVSEESPTLGRFLWPSA